MEEGINFIQDLAIVLLVAGAAGALCKRIGLSVVVGYLLAGIFIGPYTPPFTLVMDVERIEMLSQVGLVFLMFAIGLGLSLGKLRRMGVSTLVATGLGAFIVLNLTQLLGIAVGWTTEQSLFVAAMFMVSSSAVIAKVVGELNLGHDRAGQLALAITVLEDVVAVVMLAVLGSRAIGDTGPGVGTLLTGLGAFVVLLVMVGLFFVPKLLRRLEARADPELQTIIVAGVLFLMALTAVRAGYSLALGAFLLGAIVAEMPQKVGVEKAFAGMRDLFSSVFFVSIGMMIDVRLMLGAWPWVLTLGAFTLVVRALATGLALIAVGTPPRVARRAGLALTPVGEFTFVIAQLGVAAKVLPAEFYPVAVGVSLVTVLVTPVVNRRADTILRLMERCEPAWIGRALKAYHEWLTQLGSVQTGLWWRLSRGRLVQVGMEMLFVTGLLAFSHRLFGTFAASRLAEGVPPWMLAPLFWSTLGVVLLVPLVAIWRNVSALAMIFAEQAATTTRLPFQAVESGLKVLSAVGLGAWLWRIVPMDALPRWAWVAIGAVLVAVLVFFSRRLIFWHSQWQSTVRGVLAEVPEEAPPAAWLDGSGDWRMNVQECQVPEGAACSGRSIAELDVRARFGCSIAEINRQGHAIIAPEPTQALFSGDRLLLLGSPEQIGAARRALGELTPPSEAEDFDQARLETVTVPAGPRTGVSMADLKIARETGVLVAGLNRGGRRTVNPSPAEVLAEGDELLVLGAPDQIKAFRRWLEAA